ncbi:hypothetical protein DFH11DRAFT_1549453 [Phellopilus nigrolimitatus]|nr:hypothetical protein DFH11DRAFT_1549453 [Phellopilus nigrolimitatus]
MSASHQSLRPEGWGEDPVSSIEKKTRIDAGHRVEGFLTGRPCVQRRFKASMRTMKGFLKPSSNIFEQDAQACGHIARRVGVHCTSERLSKRPTDIAVDPAHFADAKLVILVPARAAANLSSGTPLACLTVQ